MTRPSRPRSFAWLVGACVFGAFLAALGACSGTGPSGSPQGQADGGGLPPDTPLPHDAGGDHDATADGGSDAATEGGSDATAHEAGGDSGGETDAPADAPSE